MFPCEHCGAGAKKHVALKSLPKIVIFQIHWENYYDPSPVNLLQVLLSLKGTLKMSELYSEAPEVEVGLKGMVVFLRNHYAYFGLGEDNRWYRVDDNLCYTIGIGRWYDVLLILLYMKGIPVGMIYEEFHVADLSLYRIEMLYLEKTVYNCMGDIQQVGNLETFADFSINPVKKLCGENLQQIECVSCRRSKDVGEVCTFCGFDPNLMEWLCEKCLKVNDGVVLMCDWCDNIRYPLPVSIERCSECLKEGNLRFCIDCDFICECGKCRKKITAMQSMFCRMCKEISKDGYCENCKMYEIHCKKCSNEEQGSLE